jgi:hypothetical protein
MSKSTKILIAAGFVALLGLIIYSSSGLARVNCEVCMEFQGRSSCRPAFGTTREEAIETATTVACADIAFGRDDSITCTNLTTPKSVMCMAE